MAANDNDNIHDDIREMRGMLTTLVAGQASTAATLAALNERLLDGDTGAIPVAFRKIADVATETKKETLEIRGIAEAAAKKVDRQAAYAAGFGACATFSMYGFRYLLSKIGVHI